MKAKPAIPENPDTLPLPQLETPITLASDKWIEALEPSEDDALAMADQTYRDAVETWRGLEEVRSNPSPDCTRAVNLKTLAMSAGTATERVLKKSAESHVALDTAKAEALAEAKRNLGIDREPEGAGEIRGIIRAMSPADRQALIDDAIANRDSVVLGAIEHAAHPLAIGLNNRDELRAIRSVVLQSTHPETVKRIERYEAAVDRLTNLEKAWQATMPTLTADDLRARYAQRAELARKAQQRAGA